MNHYRIKVLGKVQGVFYRASTKKKAQDLGIHGWVKNQKDGSVLISAEGEEAHLKSLIEWCGQGPAHAQVREVRFEEMEPEGFSGFQIIY